MRQGPAVVQYDSSGAEKATSGNPVRTDPTGTTTQPVSAASLPLPTGAATAAAQSDGSQKAVVRGGAKGVTTAADVTSTAVSADVQALDVSIKGTPTVTANVGTTNGLALDATLTGGGQKAVARGGAKGATTAADVTSTSIDADHNALDVSVKGNVSVQPGVATTSTVTSVAGSASNVTIAALNTGRLGLKITNDSSAILYLKYGATASASSWTYKLWPGDQFEMDGTLYTGQLDGIWASAAGNARVTELTA